jgi:hypothetical protein
MKRTMLGLALVTALGALVSDAGSAQRVRVDLGWHSGRGVRVAAAYASPAVYLRVGHRHCQPSGPYLYCWDTRAFRPDRAISIHVFRNRVYRDRRNYRDQRRVVRLARRMDSRAYRSHVKAARQAWHRWYRERRNARRHVRTHYGGRAAVHDPAIALRLSFHL